MEVRATAPPAPPAAHGEPQPWPALREELIIHPAPRSLFGAPTWTLEDPAGRRFFRLGWLEFEVFSRWHLADPARIMGDIAAHTTLRPKAEDIDGIVRFATANNLLEARTAQDTARLVEQRRRAKTSWFKTAMKSYLFFRIPLVRPDAFLTRTWAYVAWMFSRRFCVGLAASALLAVYLIIRQRMQFADSMAALGHWEGWAMVGLALLCSKIIHELGHGYAAKKMGLHVPSMGVALMCFAPVLWTDTTEAWRLRDKAQRLLIGLAGVLAEVTLATAASWAWLLLPPGEPRTAAFILASTTWVMTLMVNANPLMRYDAYYLLSDLWEVPSLQHRAFEVGRWHLRRTLFGLPDPLPEPLPPLWRLRFAAYAYACWVYRFFLFIGIAVLVYHLFFKLLGIVLFAIEIVFFIGLPIGKELRVWWQRRADIWRQARGKLTLGLAGAALCATLWPWSAVAIAPGLLLAEQQTGLHAPMPAIVQHALPGGTKVTAGEVIVTLTSPELAYESAVVEREIALLAARLEAISLNDRLREAFAVDWQNYQGLLHDQWLHQERAQRLLLRAPFDGKLVDVPVWCRAGQWVRPGERLGLLISATPIVAAYVAEMDLDRLRVGDVGVFAPFSPAAPHLAVEVLRIDTAATRELPYPELASRHGGPIGVIARMDKRLMPETAIYKVTCRVLAPEGSFSQSLTGMVSLHGEKRSVFATMLRNALGIVIRESGL